MAVILLLVESWLTIPTWVASVASLSPCLAKMHSAPLVLSDSIDVSLPCGVAAVWGSERLHATSMELAASESLPSLYPSMPGALRPNKLGRLSSSSPGSKENLRRWPRFDARSIVSISGFPGDGISDTWSVVDLAAEWLTSFCPGTALRGSNGACCIMPLLLPAWLPCPCRSTVFSSPAGPRRLALGDLRSLPLESRWRIFSLRASSAWWLTLRRMVTDESAPLYQPAPANQRATSGDNSQIVLCDLCEGLLGESTMLLQPELVVLLKSSS